MIIIMCIYMYIYIYDVETPKMWPGDRMRWAHLGVSDKRWLLRRGAASLLIL